MNFIDSLPDGDFVADILVKACKFDGSVHRTWKVQLIKETLDLWVFRGIFDKEIRHELLGVIRPGTISFEFYWKHRYYNVFCFYQPEGELRNFYCNINLPPVLSDNVLSYVDLDIDVLVHPDLRYEILDKDEFAENSVKHSYPPELIKTVETNLSDVISLVKNRQFPFNLPN